MGFTQISGWKEFQYFLLHLFGLLFIKLWTGSFLSPNKPLVLACFFNKEYTK